MRIVILAYAIFIAAGFADTVSDSNLGYTISLPPNWVQLKTKPEQHYFRDSTRQYHSQISILKYAIDPSAYPTPESWTQAQFIAYKLSVETSVYPFGAIAYYDSSSASELGGYWAPEALSVLYSADGDSTYCEFMHYCAVGNTGYEIYAIGDSTDMVTNVDFYAGIIETLKFTVLATSIAPNNHVSLVHKESENFFRAFDIIGREIPKSWLSPGVHRIAPQRLVSKPSS